MDICVECSHLGVIMSRDADALKELTKKYWMAADPEGYDTVGRRQKQSQRQRSSSPGPIPRDEEAAKQHPLKSEQHQAKLKPAPCSDVTPTAPAPESKPQSFASEIVKPASQITSKVEKHPHSQPQNVDLLPHPSVASQHAKYTEPASPLPHAMTLVSTESNPTSHTSTASTDFPNVHGNTPEQHEAQHSEDAKQRRIAAYAANRQGAQLEMAVSLPCDANLLSITPGTPPNEEAVTLTTRQSSGAFPNDDRMSSRSPSQLLAASQVAAPPQLSAPAPLKLNLAPITPPAAPPSHSAAGPATASHAITHDSSFIPFQASPSPSTQAAPLRLQPYRPPKAHATPYTPHSHYMPAGPYRQPSALPPQTYPQTYPVQQRFRQQPAYMQQPSYAQQPVLMGSGHSYVQNPLTWQQKQHTQPAAPSQYTPAQPIMRQLDSPWHSAAPVTAPQHPVLTGAAAAEGIKRQMRRNGVKIEEGGQPPSGSACFDKLIFIDDALKYRLVGSAEGWVPYPGASALLVIKHRHRQADVVKEVTQDEELHLHGLMLLCARASHVDFVQGWQRSDGSFGYCVQQLLHRHHPEAKYLLFLKRQQILAAVKAFVTDVYELMRAASAP